MYFSIEFQLHTNSHITLWLPVEERDQELQRYAVLFSQVNNINSLRNGEVSDLKIHLDELRLKLLHEEKGTV